MQDAAGSHALMFAAVSTVDAQSTALFGHAFVTIPAYHAVSGS
jgi:hypothetical protein